jgi:hypothetical protein
MSITAIQVWLIFSSKKKKRDEENQQNTAILFFYNTSGLSEVYLNTWQYLVAIQVWLIF